MIKIIEFKIKRFRSINELKITVDNQNSFITFCGANNVGKTNVLRALNLFFNPDQYSPLEDVPYHKLFGSRGGSVWPEISVTFDDTNNGSQYIITREYDDEALKSTMGLKSDSVVKKEKMENDSIKLFLNNIVFFYIESINISIPTVIEKLVDTVFDTEYQDVTFRGSNKVLKEAYEKYILGLENVLKKLEHEINPMFQVYKDEWGVSFEILSNITKFRELISNDVDFYINDKSNNLIESKGSGLQRLAYLLLHFRLIDKIKNKSVILLVDEPDVYLHEGLQAKLMDDFKRIFMKSQIFITTHSKIFIDMNALVNVNLLDLKIDEKNYSRIKNKQFYSLKTTLVDITSEDGAKKIREHLGITNDVDDILQPYNIIVEGESDQRYLENLIRYFNYSTPNFICANGADNIEKYLDYFESFYVNSSKNYRVQVLLDNDMKGREVYRKLIKKSYRNIKVSISFIPHNDGSLPNVNDLQKEKMNWEIEDFIYPELFIYLVNIVLKRKNLKVLNVKSTIKLLKSKSFKSKGIIELVEHEKNRLNPDDGYTIQFTTSGFATETLKNSISKLFEVGGNVKIAEILNISNVNYSEIKNFIDKIYN